MTAVCEYELLTSNSELCTVTVILHQSNALYVDDSLAGVLGSM